MQQSLRIEELYHKVIKGQMISMGSESEEEEHESNSSADDEKLEQIESETPGS